MTEPVDRETWRTFEWAAVKRFAWDACRDVAERGTYSDPWTFGDFLLASKRYAYKSHDKTTVDSFFNRNNIYIPFLEEIIKELVFWGFFSQANNAAEIEEAVYLPTQKLRDYAQVFKDLLDGEIDKVESYRTRN
jgi:hypothetical protein